MFSFYRGIYLGGLITDESMFEHCLYEAKSYLKSVASKNAVIDYENDDIKRGLCALSDAIFRMKGTSYLSKEKFGDAEKVYNNKNWYDELYKIAVMYFPQEIMYRGV